MLTKLELRRRGTAIVDTSKGILVVAGKNKLFILPGGKAEKNESRTKAACRELYEETKLKTKSIKYLFRIKGELHKSYKGGYFQDQHTVCLIETEGIPKPNHEIKYIDYYYPGCKIKISGITKEIIDKYYKLKK